MRRGCGAICATLVACLVAGPTMAEVPEPAEPSAADVVALMQQADWTHRVQAASVLFASGQVAEALTAFERVGGDLPGFDKSGMVALAIGDCYLRLKQYDKAATQYAAVAKAHPKLAETLWVRLVQIDLARGQLDAAQRRVERVLGSSVHADHSHARVWALLELGLIQERQAIDLLHQAGRSYAQASEQVVEFSRVGRCGIDPHAADVADAASQLAGGLQTVQQRLRKQLLLADPSAESSPAKVTLGRVTVAGEVATDGGGVQAVQVVRDADGDVTIVIDGVEVPASEEVARQVAKHLTHIVRIAHGEQ